VIWRTPLDPEVASVAAIDGSGGQAKITGWKMSTWASWESRPRPSFKQLPLMLGKVLGGFAAVIGIMMAVMLLTRTPDSFLGDVLPSLWSVPQGWSFCFLWPGIDQTYRPRRGLAVVPLEPRKPASVGAAPAVRASLSGWHLFFYERLAVETTDPRGPTIRNSTSLVKENVRFKYMHMNPSTDVEYEFVGRLVSPALIRGDYNSRVVRSSLPVMPAGHRDVAAMEYWKQ
jgi:hypothetical protein